MVALVALGMHASSGFPTLVSSHGDNDSLLRLVQVRDLLGGQYWYDLHQYRMGLDGGFVMHWSRVVDAPIAAIILVAASLTGSVPMGETIALVAWPLFLMACALVLMLRIARTIGGDWAVLPTVTIGGAALFFVGVFAPGAIDHHNVQLVLTLAVVLGLVTGATFASGLLAGLSCALMLAVGVETLPYVAVAGLTAAAALLACGHKGAAPARGFGIGFATAGAAAFFGTIPFDGWLTVQCDAYSAPQFTIAVLAGAGLATISAAGQLRSTFARRLLSLAALGIAVGTVAILFFPQCLAEPLADLDPELQRFWLSAVTEAQPVWSVVTRNPAMAASYYVTPLLGLIVLGLRIWKEGPKPAVLVVGAFLATAFAVSLWQVRGSMFAIPLATIPLASWVGDWRRRVAASSANGSTLKMTLAWLVSLNVAWSAAANATARALGGPVSPAARVSVGTCDRAVDFAALAAMPATTVLAISNLGAPILASTHHRVLAGPYHRNVAGNLATLKAFMGPPDEAAGIVRANNIGIVVLCRANDETAALANWAPSGFMAALVGANQPNWLEKLPTAENGALEIYRVRNKP